jgi:hypothetical protein
LDRNGTLLKENPNIKVLRRRIRRFQKRGHLA